jgi:hypothetical protein
MHRLGGWWRLWIVATTVLAAGLFAMQFQPRQRDIVETESYLTAEAVAHRLVQVRRDIKPRCVPTSYFEIPARHKDGDYLLVFACRSWASLWTMIGLALLPGALLLAIGLAVRWVRTGFIRRTT